MHIIKEPEEYSFKKVGIRGKNFPTDKLSDKAGFLIIETDAGHETTIVEHKCDFIYYILEGKGYFVIEDKKEECSKGDLVVIPAGKKFIYKGKLKMLLCSTPPWWEEQEDVVD